MDCGIAYADEKGKDFYGNPWILDSIPENMLSVEVRRLKNEGYQNVIPFLFGEDKEEREIFTWEYVNANKITKFMC